jgi:hypothetical protein
MLEVKFRHNEGEREDGPPFHGRGGRGSLPRGTLLTGLVPVTREHVEAAWGAEGFEVLLHDPAFGVWPGRPMTQQVFLLRKPAAA